MKPSIKAKLHQLKAQLKADEELRLKDPRRAEALRQARWDWHVWEEDWQEVKASCRQLKLL
jgi:hypothetical protein